MCDWVWCKLLGSFWRPILARGQEKRVLGAECWVHGRRTVVVGLTALCCSALSTQHSALPGPINERLAADRVVEI